MQTDPKSDTPRTDEQIDHPRNIDLDNERRARLGEEPMLDVVPAAFARQLERELAQAKQTAESEFKRATYWEKQAIAAKSGQGAKGGS